MTRLAIENGREGAMPFLSRWGIGSHVPQSEALRWEARNVSREPITASTLTAGLSPGFRPARALWMRQEAINWIAFGIAADRDLTGHLAIMDKWGSEPTRGGRSHEMLLPLDAAAEDRPVWTPREPPTGYPPEIWFDPPPPSYVELEARGRELMQWTGSPPSQLATELRADLLVYLERHNLYTEAENLLVEALAGQQLARQPFPDGGRYAGMAADAGWLIAVDVLRLWPIKGEPDKAPPSKAAHEMREALECLIRDRDGKPYRLIAEAYRDTLQHLRISGQHPRGYSRDRFTAACRDLLRGGPP